MQRSYQWERARSVQHFHGGTSAARIPSGSPALNMVSLSSRIQVSENRLQHSAVSELLAELPPQLTCLFLKCARYCHLLAAHLIVALLPYIKGTDADPKSFANVVHRA